MSSTKFRLALIQLAVGFNKEANLLRASRLIRQAANNDVQLVVLPECFNSPYGNAFFKTYAETLLGETTEFLSSAAESNQVYIIGGSFPERQNEQYFNTSTVWDPRGRLLAVYRKIHLCHYKMPGVSEFQEFKALSPGTELTSFQLADFCQVGIGICFDMRFPKIAQLYAQRGCKLIVYPGAFSAATPYHWNILQRCRAIDNQVYVAVASQARIDNAPYVALGNSSVASPWGDIVSETGTDEDIVYATIDLEYLQQVRRQLPIDPCRQQQQQQT